MSENTRDKILAEATRLMRQRGYAAFSYADLSKTIGITKASIHHHFATKEVLAEEVIKSSLKELAGRLVEFDLANTAIHDKLKAYSVVFLEGHETGQLPMCCALSAEMNNLPESLRSMVAKYFTTQITWITAAVASSQERGETRLAVDAAMTAHNILNLFEGASIVSRATGSEAAVENAFSGIVKLLNCADC